ncbi:MAG: DUF421 domain-containing protein [Pyrinomonadaceae bacterium]
MFFDNWWELWRPIVVGVLAYLGLVFFLRISGKRTLSKMDSFDFVITTALGSTLAQVVLSKDVALLKGLLGFAVIISLQVVATELSKLSPAVRRLIKSEPTLLFYKGEFQRRAMKHERIPEIEILAAIRMSGIAAIEDVEAVVLEADSDFSVIKGENKKSDSALADVSGYASLQRPKA